MDWRGVETAQSFAPSLSGRDVRVKCAARRSACFCSRSKRHAGAGFIAAFIYAAPLDGVTRTGYTLIIDQRRSTGQFVRAAQTGSSTDREPCRFPTEATAEVDRSGVRCRAAGSL